MRPEFAAWRYGDQFGRRRRKNAMLVGTGVAAITLIPFVGMAAGVSFGVAANIVRLVYWGERLRSQGRILTRIHHNGKLLDVNLLDADHTVLLAPTSSEPWGLRIAHRPDETQTDNRVYSDLRGEDAMRAAAQICHVSIEGEEIEVSWTWPYEWPPHTKIPTRHSTNRRDIHMPPGDLTEWEL